MGKILNGILGGVSGKVGGVVGSNWKGIDTLRAYAIPANPQTSGQTLQRNKFTAIMAMLKTILATVIQVYWDPFATGMSGFNAAMSANLDNWSAIDDYDLSVIAQGSLESDTLAVSTYATGTGACVFAWDETILGNGELTDKAVVVVIDVANNIAFVDDSATRDDEGTTPNIGAGRTVTDLHAFLFFTRGTGESLEVSNSDYSAVSAP